MKRRFTKLPIASIAVVIGCLLIGLSLSPVGAQTGLVNGQVTVRSDGAVYLISNGMRRWVATVVITDEELNAYPEAEPIYAGLAPFGSASAGTATKTGTTASTGNTAAKTTGTTGTTATKTTGNTATKTTGSSQTSTQTTDDEESDDGTIDPGSGADPKDPNDPTLAEVTTSVDPNAKAEPTGKTTCPNSHQIKGGFDKYYWDTDRPDYATVEPEACFVSGAYAREFGYIEIKKKPGSSTTTKPTPTSTPKPR